ncbi:NAD-dependent epimerase/dehydratase family protein [Micromonospora echinofusca]|uniref:NAD-dependent epimerase/dehydratase family protein n=1 Tax=Micromonospora echinofusca TaxID=47858 RepID=UPI0034054045
MSTLLVLGGTQFLGRAVAEEGVRRGARVVVAHRGEHEPPPGVTAVRGDRTDPGSWAEVEERLTRERWDLVVDTWSGDPAAVRRSTAALRGRADRYTYVSSRSVYAWPAVDGADEDAPLVDPPSGDDPDELGYAESKLAAELAVEQAFGARALILRAGLLVGPRENTGRLPRWLARLAAGGPVPVPGPADLDWQYVDARDLAAWTLRAAADGLGGVFDAVGPPGGTTTAELLELGVEITGGGSTLHWREPAAFAAAGVEPWTDLPGWFPPGPEHAAVHRGAAAKAARHGLVQRPLRDTVTDTWAWMCTADGRAACRDLDPLWSPEVERRLLDAG